MEEFFKCPQPEEENQLETEFQDLEYELRRQASDSGNSYVGQRLAKGRPEQADFCIRVDSPRKHVTNPNLLGLPVRCLITRGRNDDGLYGRRYGVSTLNNRKNTSSAVILN